MKLYEQYLSLLIEGVGKSLINLKGLHSQLLDKQIKSGKNLLNTFNKLRYDGLPYEDILKHHNFKLASYRLDRIKKTRKKVGDIISKYKGR
jgi:hypothetical protein